MTDTALPSTAAAVQLDFKRDDSPLDPRPSTSGKFLATGNNKLIIKGVSYGTFADSSPGIPYPSPAAVARDFDLMRQAGLNTVRVYTVPPTWLLDEAASQGLRTIVGIPWPQHLCLRTRKDRMDVLTQVRDSVRQIARHPAVLAYFIGNEIPSPIVRWYGKDKTERLLFDLYDTAKQTDAEALVSYANYPATEYLELPFLDFHAFNVYLHEQHDLRAYLAKLQTLAGVKPLVISEFGHDSLRHGEAGQASFLEWQIREIFASGCAGAVAFTWTDDWFRGGHVVEDWAFGLVDRDRHPKPSFHTAANAFAEAPFGGADWPRVTIVIAAYNAASTLDECLSSLVQMHYPDYEVIVVDDGSTDETGRIADAYAAEFPYVKAIHESNEGLSVARNIGLSAATGEIVAYTDADCRVDPDWLFYMAAKLMQSHTAAVGGPNLVPADDCWIAHCVGHSPGGPTHILLSDEIAEHIPGCNMACWKTVLQDIKGFHPDYHVAGDDVDLCWRLQAHGQRIGFAPGALVWHHRRSTVRAYLKQQVGYGRSEAILERQHPEKFNGLGQMQWSGRIYSAPLRLLWGSGRIYQGVFGLAPFQSLYHPAPTLWMYLPLTPEWYMLIGLLIMGALFVPWSGVAALFATGLTILYAARASLAADLPRGLSNWERFKQRGMIALLHFLQPSVRAWGRLQGGLGPFRFTNGSSKRAPQGHVAWRHIRAVLGHCGGFEVAFWSKDALEPPVFLRQVMSQLHKQRLGVNMNSGWEPWDLLVEDRMGVQAHIQSTVEDHGELKRLLRARVRTTVTPVALAVGVVLGVVAVWLIRSETLETSQHQRLAWVAVLLPFVWVALLAIQRLWLAARIVATAERVADELGSVRLE